MSSLHAERGVRSFPSVSSPGSRKNVQHGFHRRHDRSHIRHGDTSISIKCQSAVPGGGNGDNKNSGIGRLLKTVQGALPVVGLLSRLTSAEGGVGNDDCAYPEYCRMVYEAAPEGFQIALADLQSKYGDCAQRRYVLLVLWMVKEGCGIVSDKLIVDSARRVRVSYVIYLSYIIGNVFLGKSRGGILSSLLGVICSCSSTVYTLNMQARY